MAEGEDWGVAVSYEATTFSDFALSYIFLYLSVLKGLMKNIFLVILLVTCYAIPLHSQTIISIPLGTASNMYGIEVPEINRLAANPELNTLVFIHRADSVANPALNQSYYLYDVSYDGGDTWLLNQGPLNISANTTDLASRNPNCVIHNDPGNIAPDSAYLGYLGSYLSAGAINPNWNGMFTGTAKLNNDTTTFTETIFDPNSGKVSASKSMVNGAPGIFWAIDFGTDPITDVSKSILLYKGTWNEITQGIDWIIKENFTPSFDLSFDGNPKIVSPNVAFDPTGQYGWVSVIADIDPDTIHQTYHPVFYNTIDGGANWAGPIDVDLMQMENLQTFIQPSNIAVLSATFETDLVVDVYGKPHTVMVITASSDSYIMQSGLGEKMGVYDITFNDSCGWHGVFLDSVETFKGEYAINYLGYNHPQASRTPDGHKVMFGWVDSDATFTNGENVLPNLFTKSIDVITWMATPTINHTQGDPNWDGQAIFPSFAPVSFIDGDTIKIPVVLAQFNQNTFKPYHPASFFYLSNIQYFENNYTIDVRGVCITVINETPDPPKVIVYPNPNKGIFTISASYPGASTLNVQIINALGQVVTVSDIDFTEIALLNYQLNFTTGMYLMRVQVGDEVIMRKIIIE